MMTPIPTPDLKLREAMERVKAHVAKAPSTYRTLTVFIEDLRLLLQAVEEGDELEQANERLARLGRAIERERDAALTAKEEAERRVGLRERQIETSRRAWLRAAEAALGALPGASNSTHPAHDLWLRVEMSKQPPVEIVQSTLSPVEQEKGK